MCFHAGDDFLLVTLGQDANLSARSPPIAPKIEQLVDLLDRKAQGSSPFDEAQLMYIALVEDPVTTGVPAGEAQQAYALVIPDQPCRDTGKPGRVANAHHLLRNGR
jgi:hypothetical protein